MVLMNFHVMISIVMSWLPLYVMVSIIMSWNQSIYADVRIGYAATIIDVINQ